MATSDAPLEISHVRLRVRDLEEVADYYRALLGFADRPGEKGTVALGTADETLLVLEAAPDAPPHHAGQAGLYHTAFLLPDRPALGAFLAHVRDGGFALDGAADHHVSEALYLSDPEGNGIEVYRDRPREDWRIDGEAIYLDNTPLDARGILAAAAGDWQGAPSGTVVGHVHLCVSDLAPAAAFFTDTLGLALTARFPGANFFGSGGYHHHIGANIWHSRGAPAMPAGGAGLISVHLSADAPTFERLAAATEATTGNLDLAGPSGIPIAIARRPAKAAAA